jgi:SAM-dependent methyltransferase
MDAQHRKQARSFGAVAIEYERARPSYPPQAARWLVEAGPGREVIDLAAGTGKLTRVLAGLGYDVTAVEPLAGMREQLEAAAPGIPVLEGTAEAIPAADASADAVLVAQAFHWFDAPAALDEIARVLRPGGVLGMLWNLRDDSVDWMQPLNRLLRRPGDLVSMSRDLAREEAEGHPHFSGIERREFPNPLPYTPELLGTWARSTSRIAVLPEDEREQVIASIMELTRTHPGLRGRETFELPLVTVCVRARRTA